MSFQLQPPALPGLVAARTANVRRVSPEGWLDSLWGTISSWLGGGGGGDGGNAVTTSIQKMLEDMVIAGVGDAAEERIENTEMGLGGSLQPSGASWTQAYKWAIVLIVICCIICALAIALVVAGIVVERRLEKKEKRRGKSDDSDDDDGDDDNDDDAASNARSGKKGGSNSSADSEC